MSLVSGPLGDWQFGGTFSLRRVVRAVSCRGSPLSHLLGVFVGEQDLLLWCVSTVLWVLWVLCVLCCVAVDVCVTCVVRVVCAWGVGGVGGVGVGVMCCGCCVGVLRWLCGVCCIRSV